MYEILTGEHYLDFSPEADLAYEQVLADRPLPFTRRGFESWPVIERALQRALSKNVLERYASAAAFSTALRRARVPLADELDAAFEQRVRPFVNRFVPAVGDALPPLRSLFKTAPIIANDRGAGGYAWFLYRVAVLRERPDLLALADIWCRRAAAAMETEDAFHTPASADDDFQIDACSILHRPAGIHYVHALTCQARGDLAGLHAQTDAFLATSTSSADVADVTLGRAGVLLASSTLLCATSSATSLGTKKLATAVEEGLHELVSLLDATPPPGLIARQPYSFAHGWAGILYALMRAAVALDRPLPSDLPAALSDRLDEWTASLQSTTADAPDSWFDHRAERRSGERGWIPGWCNGTAGCVPLFLLAHQVYRKEVYAELAEWAATRTASHEDRHGHLCCGLAGRVFALLHMYRHTGQSRWLDHARSLARHLIDPKLPEETAARTHSLFWGALGCALALEELKHPEWATMPLFGDLGWPRA